MRTPSLKQTEAWLKAVTPELDGYEGRKLDKSDLSGLAVKAYRTVHKTKEPDAVVVGCAYRCLEHLLGTYVTRAILCKNMHRLLANWDLVTDGVIIPEWDGAKTYVCLVVLGIARVATPPGAPQRFVLKLKLKTGLPAGIIQCAVVTDRQIADFLQHKSGTAALECSVEEISGMHIRAALSMDASGTIRIHEWDCTEEQKKRNRDLANRRLDVAKCANSIPCNVCEKTVAECPLAIWLPKPKEKQ